MQEGAGRCERRHALERVRCGIRLILVAERDGLADLPPVPPQPRKFAFALRGAGDTKYVTILTFTLAWPLMVIPTALTVYFGGSVYWCWVFATAHIVGMSVCFWFRFRSGKWKSMRVIESASEEAKKD